MRTGDLSDTAAPNHDRLEDELCQLHRAPPFEVSRCRRRSRHDPHRLEPRHTAVAPCSTSTIWRVLTRGALSPQSPTNARRPSYKRFEAALPNERWQMDVTHVELRSGRVVEVLNVIDDHSRLLVASRAFSVGEAARKFVMAPSGLQPVGGTADPTGS